MELIERVKAECEGHSHDCANCRLNIDGTRCMIVYFAPLRWDIEAIRKALGETSDKASDKEELVVPKRHEDNYINALKGTIYNNVLIKQNEIIDCLEQIKEIVK